MLTILKSAPNLLLAKTWTADGRIVSAADVAWFKAEEVPTESLADFLVIIEAVQHDRHVAIVKEAIASGANPQRLRRRCVAGVDERKGEDYPAGLRVVARNWLVIDVDGLLRPPSTDWRDGTALAEYVRGLLPGIFRSAACVWQLSCSSGHPTKINEIRMHMFFMCDSYVFPKAWNNIFTDLKFIDKGIYDNAKLIFTAKPVIEHGQDPLLQRHGLLAGEPVVRVPAGVKARSMTLKLDITRQKDSLKSITCTPMPEVAAAFVEIIAKSNVLRSQHPSYQLDRSRRLAFCSILTRVFGINDEESLVLAFYKTCVGPNDRNGDHDAREALAWAKAPPQERLHSLRKLMCDAATALRADGNTEVAVKAAYLAHYFWKHETGALL